jgi:mono/diheme cytochrome c family protein
MDSGPLTASLGVILLLIWVTGTVLVWWYSWLAAAAFASAAALTLTPAHALPLPSLLVAVSTALALWSLFANLASALNRRSPSPAETGERLVSDGSPISSRHCVICHRPTEAAVCADCTTALGASTDAWLVGESPAVPNQDRAHGHQSKDAPEEALPVTRLPARRLQERASSRMSISVGFWVTGASFGPPISCGSLCTPDPRVIHQLEAEHEMATPTHISLVLGVLGDVGDPYV